MNDNKSYIKGTGNNLINHLALQEAIQELEKEKQKNESLRKDLKIFDKENITLKLNLEVLINTNKKIKDICIQNRTSEMAKEILKELGE